MLHISAYYRFQLNSFFSEFVHYCFLVADDDDDDDDDNNNNNNNT